MIYNILYISEVSEHYNKERDLEHILKSSQENNNLVEVTGILIKNNKFFIQLLEGSKSSVEKTYLKISKDIRHKSIRILMDYKSNERIFPNWAMGYTDLNTNKDVKLREIIPLIHKDIINSSSSKEKILTILRNFNKVS